MKKENTGKSGIKSGLILSDILSYTVVLLPGLLTFVFLYSLRAFIFYPLFPIAIVLSFIFFSFVVRLCLPSLKKGVYPMGLNRGFLSWYLHLALSRSAAISGIKPFIHAFYCTKYLYWRALGADVDFGIHSSINVSFVDYGMISVRKGCTLADEVAISGHTFVGDRLVIGPVKIEEGVFIGLGSTIGPRTKIGARSWIGMGNILGNVTLAPESKIQNYEWEHGKPKSPSPVREYVDSPV